MGPIEVNVSMFNDNKPKSRSFYKGRRMMVSRKEPNSYLYNLEVLVIEVKMWSMRGSDRSVDVDKDTSPREAGMKKAGRK